MDNTIPNTVIPSNVPIPVAPKHPLRFGISGRQHMIPQLKQAIADDQKIPAEYKTVILRELDLRKSNAAQVDLHVVDHENGDTSIHIHIKEITLG